MSTIPVLVVDLDNTLLRTDLLWEAITELVRRKPYLLPAVPLVLLRGRVALKRWLARHVELDFASLPINEEVLAYVHEAKAQGRRVVLATAALDAWAQQVAEQCGCFDAVIATEPTGINNTGSAKLERIRQLCNGAAFEYIGDRAVDIPVWRAAERALIVGDALRFEKRIGRRFAREFPRPRATIHDWLRLLRIEQWSKNLLVFVPIILAHRFSDLHALGMSFLAAVALSVVASSLYVFNDLLDLKRDRQHPTKRQRPLARGLISLQAAWIAVLVGLCLGAAGTIVLLPSAAALIAVYACTSAAYSLWLKHRAIIDVITLAGLYTLRIGIGGAAAHVEISPWLLGFSFVFFTSLALLKRHSEAVHLRRHGVSISATRPYSEADEPFLLATGIATSATAVLVLILYMTSERVRLLYRHPDALWLVLPLVLAWMLRMWLLSVRGKIDSDPLSVAVRDGTSIAIAAAVLLVVTVVAR